MVRAATRGDLEALLHIWLSGNLEAHSFIPPEYWYAHLDEVRDQLPQAELWVWETDGTVQGFAGITGDYLAGIFVDGACRCAGIGHALLTQVKARHPSFSLSVYRRNERALRFYLREGLTIAGAGTDEATGQAEYTMCWHGDKSG